MNKKIDNDTRKSIVIPFSENDLDRLRNGDTFDWTFDGVDVHLRLETEEDLEFEDN